MNYPNEEAKALLSSIKEDVKQLFIVSELAIGGTEADAPEDAQSFETGKIVVAQAEGETCERCRMVSKEIGEDPDHPELCPRCAGIVKTYYQSCHEICFPGTGAGSAGCRNQAFG